MTLQLTLDKLDSEHNANHLFPDGKRLDILSSMNMRVVDSCVVATIMLGLGKTLMLTISTKSD